MSAPSITDAFLKMKRNAEKEAKKKRADTPMDTSPDARVMDFLDQHLKQLGLGLIRRKSRSNSPASSKSRSATPGSRSRSKSVSTSSCSSGSSRNSSHNF